MTFMKKRAKGILLCFLLAAFAWLLVAFIPKLEVIGAPILAILTGMILMPFLKATSNLSDGIGFTSKKILQYAVILLGFGLNLNTIKSVGLLSLPIILSTISVSLLVSYILHKLMKIPAKTSTLIGVGSSICGGSAIAATAPVIGADDEEIAQAISVIFLFNVVAALIFPALGTILGLSNTGFGLFAGTAINDTSSVTAAASTWDTLHGTNGSVLAYATIVKLTRTLAIIPITLVLSFVRMRGERKNNINQQGKISIKGVFPLFILYFIIASLITTVITSTCSGASLKIAETIFAHIKQLSKFFIVMAMAAIGLNTSLKKLIKNGPKPIILGFCCWVSIATVSIALQKLLHIL